MRSFKNTLDKTHSFQRPLLSCRPYDKCFSLPLNHWLGLEPIYEMIILKKSLFHKHLLGQTWGEEEQGAERDKKWPGRIFVRLNLQPHAMIKPRGKNSHQVNCPYNDYPSANLKASKKELGPWKAIVDAQLWNLTKRQLILLHFWTNFVGTSPSIRFFWGLCSPPLWPILLHNGSSCFDCEHIRVIGTIGPARAHILDEHCFVASPAQQPRDVGVCWGDEDDCPALFLLQVHPFSSRWAAPDLKLSIWPLQVYCTQIRSKGCRICHLLTHLWCYWTMGLEWCEASVDRVNIVKALFSL